VIGRWGGHRGRMTKRNPVVLAMIAAMLLVFGYAYWINAAQ
jgi:hypothetical protein